jgi:hypothetical protein
MGALASDGGGDLSTPSHVISLRAHRVRVPQI